MTLTIRYFASLREQLGRETETLAYPPAGLTVDTLRQQLCLQGEPHATALAPGRAVRASVNFELAEPQTQVPDGAEVAFFPPVTGG